MYMEQNRGASEKAGILSKETKLLSGTILFYYLGINSFLTPPPHLAHQHPEDIYPKGRLDYRQNKIYFHMNGIYW